MKNLKGRIDFRNVGQVCPTYRFEETRIRNYVNGYKLGVLNE